MGTIYSIPTPEYNTKLAVALKELPEFEVPEWARFVKTGMSKDRPPINPDFWYIRAASILRQLYIHHVVGVNRLKTRYGSKKNRGMKPEKFYKGSGKIIRVILQQAEAAGLVEQYKDAVKRSGRKLTDQGKQFLESIQ